MKGFHHFIVFSLISLTLNGVVCPLWSHVFEEECNSDQYFKCSSGGCTKLDNLCDGIPHCVDGSDETSLNCHGVVCQSYLFRCSYGACIDASKKCNGITDCLDNSDEMNCTDTPTTTPTTVRSSTSTTTNTNPSRITTSTTPRTSSKIYARTSTTTHPKSTTTHPKSTTTHPTITTSTTTSTTPTTSSTTPRTINCILPPFPTNGKWFNADLKPEKPGHVVPRNTILFFQCNPGYKLQPNVVVSFCNDDGEWTKSPKCLKTCPTLEVNSSFGPICTYEGYASECMEPYEGTTAIIRYDLSNNVHITSKSVCVNGIWEIPPTNQNEIKTPCPTNTIYLKSYDDFKKKFKGKLMDNYILNENQGDVNNAPDIDIRTNFE